MARSTSLLFVALGPEVATLPFVEIWLPQCRRRVQRGPLGPCSQKFAGAQVAGNSNLKLGDTPLREVDLRVTRSSESILDLY